MPSEKTDLSAISAEGAHRRQFLRVGAAAGVATMGAACVPAGKTPWSGTVPKGKLLSDKEMTAYLDQMDKGLADISKGSLLKGIAQANGSKNIGKIDHLAEKERLAQGAVRTLYFTGMYNDLSEENRQHPEVQKRLQRQIPEIDESLFSMTAYLGSQTQQDLKELQTTLKQNRDTGLVIAEPLGRAAKKIGVSAKRRAQMRTMLTIGAWRLQSQPPSLIIDEYVKKVTKVAARQGQTEQLMRYFAAKSGDAVFWEHQRKLAQAPPPAAPGPKRAVSRPVASSSAPPHRPALEPEKTRKQVGPGQGAVNAGLILLGITAGLGALGGGLLVTPAWIVGAIILTHGALTLLAGLICLIVGAAKNSSAD